MQDGFAAAFAADGGRWHVAGSSAWHRLHCASMAAGIRSACVPWQVVHEAARFSDRANTNWPCLLALYCLPIPS